MEINTAIELQAFGDFNIKITYGIFVSEEKFDIEKIKSDFCRINNLGVFNGLSTMDLDKHTEDFVTYLELIGFKELKTNKVYFCD